MHLWSHPSFQKRYIRQFVVVTFFFSFLCSLVVFYAFSKMLREEFSQSRFTRQLRTFAAVKIALKASPSFDPNLLESPDLIEKYQRLLLADLLILGLRTLALCFVVFIPLLILVGVILSHRMVGGSREWNPILKRSRRDICVSRSRSGKATKCGKWSKR